MAPAPTNRIFLAIPSSQCGSSARYYRASCAPRRWANGLRSRPLIARILPTIPAIIVLKGGGHEPARTSVLGGNRSAVRGTSCPGPGVTRWKGQGNGRGQLQQLPPVLRAPRRRIHGRGLAHRHADDDQSRSRRTGAEARVERVATVATGRDHFLALSIG